MSALLALPTIAALAHAAAPMAASAASTLVSAAWEGTVLVVALALCLRLFPGLSAAARSVVWVNAFLLLVLLQILPYVGAQPSTGIAPQSAVFHMGFAWCYASAGVWLFLSILRGAQLLLGAIRLRRLASRAVAVQPDAALQSLLQVRTAVAKIRRNAELCVSTEVERPSVFGFLHPRILVPPVLLERLTDEELRQVVLHEMEHLRRADDWTNLLQKLALVIFPLNPALFWVERRLCAERELACDDHVLCTVSGRKAYAICLTHLAEYSMLRRSLSLALGAWERRPELVRRVHRILGSPYKTMSRTRTMTLTGSLTIAVLGCALWLGRSPQLVDFVEPVQITAAGNAMPPANGVHTQFFQRTGTGMAQAEMVKAEMTPTASFERKARASRTSVAAHGSAPTVKNAVLRSKKAPDDSRRRLGWVVLTHWTETSPSGTETRTETSTSWTEGSPSGTETNTFLPETSARPHIVWAVSHDRVAPYAAIPTPNGWLFIQI